MVESWGLRTGGNGSGRVDMGVWEENCIKIGPWEVEMIFAP